MRLVITVLATCGLLAAASSDPVEFKTHIIEDAIPGGYAVLVVDMNNDGKPDVLGMTGRMKELPWYENPTWERHVVIENMNGLVNMAAHDVDGDGVPELSIENEFSMVAAKSRGLVWVLEHQGDPRRPWKATEIDELTTSHHVAWADVDGDGKKELINAPLIGADALAPKYEDNVPLVYYPVPKGLAGKWERKMITDNLTGVLHRVRVVQWDDDKREELLTAGFDGIYLHDPVGKGKKIRWENTQLSKGHAPMPKTAGASDVAMGTLNGNRLVASVGPWHGHQVVVYTADPAGNWERNVIFEGLTEGHEVCLGDFNGDGRDDVVAGDRARGKVATSHVFYAQDDAGAEWTHRELDHLGMSASGCAVDDINGDGRPDIIQIGGATKNIKWYENLGE